LKKNKTSLKDVYILKSKISIDSRGYFQETSKEAELSKLLPTIKFIQDNESYSHKNVLRGLHLQLPPFEQSKLVRVSYGEILDVIVDLRKESPTFLKWEGFKLNNKNHDQLFVPKGFAHGFIVLSDIAIVNYKVDNLYNKESEAGVHFADNDLNIDWHSPSNKIITSQKDKNLPSIQTLLDKLNDEN